MKHRDFKTKTYHQEEKYSYSRLIDSNPCRWILSINCFLSSFQTALTQCFAMTRKTRTWERCQTRFNNDGRHPTSACVVFSERSRPLQKLLSNVLIRQDKEQKTHRVKSFNFNTINTLLGILLNTSNTEIRTPSFCTTAYRMASRSISVCFVMSIILDARSKPPSCSSSQLSFSAIRPVIAASKIGYYNQVQTSP